MNILILGAGQVGAALVEYLSQDQENDLTIIDIDSDKLQQLERHFDIKTICGYGAYPEMLESANIKKMDMLIAVTFSDEVNMIACQLAHTLYNVKKKIARIRSVEYLQKKELFSQHVIPIDYIISPEILITQYIHRIVDTPGALQVLDFENGLVQMITVRAYKNGLFVGKEIREMHDYLQQVKMRIVGLYRDRQIMPTNGDTVINSGDDIYFVTQKYNTKKAIESFRQGSREYNNIIIAGGGHIGFKLAEVLEKEHYLRVIDLSLERVNEISVKLKQTLVLHGSATDENLLLTEGIEQTDLFLALTESDETNMMAAILAKQLGAKCTITLLKRNIYADLARQNGNIDAVISPDQITAGRILSQIRRGDTMEVYSLKQGRAEAIEIIVHGTENTSLVVGRLIRDINLPAGATVCCIVRGDKVIMGSTHERIESGDHVVFLLIDMTQIHKVESLFQEQSNAV